MVWQRAVFLDLYNPSGLYNAGWGKRWAAMCRVTGSGGAGLLPLETAHSECALK